MANILSLFSTNLISDVDLVGLICVMCALYEPSSREVRMASVSLSVVDVSYLIHV